MLWLVVLLLSRLVARGAGPEPARGGPEPGRPAAVSERPVLYRGSTKKDTQREFHFGPQQLERQQRAALQVVWGGGRRADNGTGEPPAPGPPPPPPPPGAREQDLTVVPEGSARRIITTTKYTKFRVVPTIVNGLEARPEEFPYLVSIKRMIRREAGETLWLHMCGGALLGPGKVLSAAHCFEGDGFFLATHHEGLRLVAGGRRTAQAHGEADSTDADGQWRRVRSVVTHPDFQFPNADLALVFATVEFRPAAAVLAVRPARRHEDYSACVAAGFGRTAFGAGARVPPRLLLGRVHVFPRAVCSFLWEMDMDRFLCSGSRLADVAEGDSGGPLVCAGSAEAPDAELMVGVVSGKNFDKTSLFTRVSRYSGWLDSDGADSPQPAAAAAAAAPPRALLLIVLGALHMS